MAQLSGETGNIDSATAENEAPCMEGACKNGACIDGIVSQQSWLCPALCESQGIVSQHCIASSAEAIGVQSTAYPASANATTATKIGLSKLILNKVKHIPSPSQAHIGDALVGLSSKLHPWRNSSLPTAPTN